MIPHKNILSTHCEHTKVMLIAVCTSATSQLHHNYNFIIVVYRQVSRSSNPLFILSFFICCNQLQTCLVCKSGTTLFNYTLKFITMQLTSYG